MDPGWNMLPKASIGQAMMGEFNSDRRRLWQVQFSIKLREYGEWRVRRFATKPEMGTCVEGISWRQPKQRKSLSGEGREGWRK
jgi:hypothetical protein